MLLYYCYLIKLPGSVDKEQTKIGVFIDLAKAFDMVDHQIIFVCLID